MAKSEEKPTSNARKTAVKTKSADQPVSPLLWLGVMSALVLITMLVYQLRDRLDPIILALAILVIIYPHRKIRGVLPILLLTMMVLLMGIWWRLSSLLIPFIVAFVIAYMLNPFMEWLEARKIPRQIVVAVLAVAVLVLVVGTGILIVPRLIEEVATLASNIPDWIDSSGDWGRWTLLPWLQGLGLPVADLETRLQSELPNLVEGALGRFSSISASTLEGLSSLLSGLANLVLIPILTVYFLFEYRSIRRRAYRLIPETHRELGLKIYERLNGVLSAFFRGQILVVIFLATWISLGLWLIADIPYALLLGICMGFLNLIPYIGYLLGLTLTIMIAMFQPDPLFTSLKALVVFFSAQSLEGNLITPRLVGDKVGLHPIVVILTVLVFGTLWGVMGMLLAIPVTASAVAVYKTVTEYKTALPVSETGE